MSITITLQSERNSISVQINENLPLLPQIRTALYPNENKEEKFVAVYDGGKITSTKTSRELGIANGEGVDIFFPIAKAAANQALVRHIEAEFPNA